MENKVDPKMEDNAKNTTQETKETQNPVVVEEASCSRKRKNSSEIEDAKPIKMTPLYITVTKISPLPQPPLDSLSASSQQSTTSPRDGSQDVLEQEQDPVAAAAAAAEQAYCFEAALDNFTNCIQEECNADDEHIEIFRNGMAEMYESFRTTRPLGAHGICLTLHHE